MFWILHIAYSIFHITYFTYYGLNCKKQGLCLVLKLNWTYINTDIVLHIGYFTLHVAYLWWKLQRLVLKLNWRYINTNIVLHACSSKFVLHTKSRIKCPFEANLQKLILTLHIKTFQAHTDSRMKCVCEANLQTKYATELKRVFNPPSLRKIIP